MAKNNEAKKYYLSPAAIARLRAESRRSAYPMSVIIDMLILKHIPPVEIEFRVVPLPVDCGADAALKVVDKVTRDIKDAMRLPTGPRVDLREHHSPAPAAHGNTSIAKPEDASTSKERFKIDL